MIYVNSLKSHHLVECAHRFNFRQPSLSTGVFLSSLLFLVLHRCTWWPPTSRLLSHQEQQTLVEHFSEHCLSPLLFLGVTVHSHTWGIPCSLKPFSPLNALVQHSPLSFPSVCHSLSPFPSTCIQFSIPSNVDFSLSMYSLLNFSFLNVLSFYNFTFHLLYQYCQNIFLKSLSKP